MWLFGCPCSVATNVVSEEILLDTSDLASEMNSAFLQFHQNRGFQSERDEFDFAIGF